jgi:hypothetical protein
VISWVVSSSAWRPIYPIAAQSLVVVSHPEYSQHPQVQRRSPLGLGPAPAFLPPRVRTYLAALLQPQLASHPHSYPHQHEYTPSPRMSSLYMRRTCPFPIILHFRVHHNLRCMSPPRCTRFIKPALLTIAVTTSATPTPVYRYSWASLAGPRGCSGIPAPNGGYRDQKVVSRSCQVCSCHGKGT